MNRIILISGSARNGNCKLILEDIQKHFWLDIGTDVIFLRDFDLTPCYGCMACEHTDGNECVKGDKHHLIMQKIDDSDIVILATPNYFYNMSSLTKNFIDKTIAAYNTGTLKGKKFIFVYTGEDSEENTKKYLDSAMFGFIDCHELNVLGSFAYKCSSIGDFKNPQLKDSTTEDICNLIRKNLPEDTED